MLGQALPPPINVARNSHAISSNVESASLELQCFRVISKSDRGEITCEICLGVVGSPPAGAVARPVSRSAPVLSDPLPSAPGCMSGRRWGFAPLEASCRRVVALLVQFPPFGGALDVGQAQPCTSHSAIPPFAGCEVAVRSGEVTVRGGVVPKVQTTSATNANNGVLRARWSAMWAQRRLAARVARARTAECAR